MVISINHFPKPSVKTLNFTETLRMYGPIFQLIRTAAKDYKVPKTNLTIRKGTLTLIPTYAIHNDPDIYSEPEKFDPERFSEENKKNRHAMAFLPFGDGPRNVS